MSICIDNQSRVPTIVLKGLIEFLFRFAPEAVVARFEVRDGAVGHSTSGRATRFFETRRTLYPALVEINIGQLPASTYPRLDQHVPDLPPILLRSLEEETVLVIAHELRHVVQFFTSALNTMDERQKEVDAERFAIETLQRWRQTDPNRRCRTVLKRAA
jgi:hypothetical protein